MAIGKKELFFLLAVMAISAFFRLWQLDSLPPGLYPDIAINGNDALDSIRDSNFKVFYPENNGREGLFMWLITLSFSFFGASIWSIKIVSAIAGILTVLGEYLLVKELLGTRDKEQATSNAKKSATAVALFSAFFLAVGFWHVNFSRMGFRAILLPFVLVFSFYFLFRGFRRKKITDLIASGVFFGLGFYTYTTFRLAVLLLVAALLGWFLIYWKQKQLRRFFILVTCLLSLIFIVALPIGIYFLQHPQDFIGRAAGVSVFKTANPLEKTFESLAIHLGMFNFYGDANWRHNVAKSPELYWPVGSLFLLGIFLAIKRFFASLKRKDIDSFLVYFFLLSWFAFMLLASVLTYEGIPHALRSIGTIPVVFIFSGMGAYCIYDFLRKKIQFKIFLVVPAMFLLMGIAIAEFNKYFVIWGMNPVLKAAFSENYVEIGQYLNSLPEDAEKFVIVNQSGVPVPWPSGIPMPAQTVIFLERTKYGEPQSVYLLPGDINKIKIYKNAQIVPLDCNGEIREKLKAAFPSGQIVEKNDFCVFQANKQIY